MRLSPNNGNFYFRYCDNGRRYSTPMGRFSKHERAGFLTLDQARAQAQRLSLGLKSPDGIADVARPSAARKLNIDQSPSTSATKRAPTEVQTLWDVCTAYVEHLIRLKRASAKQVKNTLNLYVASWPIAKIAASEVTSEQISDALRAMDNEGKGNRVDKLRSFLHSAYAAVLKARLDPHQPKSMLFPDVKRNPVSDVPAGPEGLDLLGLIETVIPRRRRVAGLGGVAV